MAAFHEAQGKFHDARKNADHWRANHADLLRRFKVAQHYRGELVEGVALLKRAVDEGADHLLAELHRAITGFLVNAEKTLEALSEDGPK